MSSYILVDFANLVHRCKHISAGDVETKTGMAFHITLNSLRQVWRKFNGSHVVVCLEGKSWRNAVYPGYKAQRRLLEAKRTRSEIEDDEFYFTAMRNFVDFLKKRTNVTVLQHEIAEADDFIAQWISLHPNDSHVIFSGDSDFYQLLNDKVTIYDGVKGWTISTTEVLNEYNKPAVIKRNVKTKNAGGKLVSKTVEYPVEPPDPQYELFKKIVRGDPSDNIMGSYPGVRENGNATKAGILEAFNDRHKRGYDWNQFMLTEWEKLIGVSESGDPIMKTVRVKDEFILNSSIIDLSAMPQEVKDTINTQIMIEVEKPVKQGVEVWFFRFAEQMDLSNIAKNPTEYAQILAAPYAS